MKIKSIPENPTSITLSALNAAVKIYEGIMNKMDDKNPWSVAYDLGRMATFELFFNLLGVQFESGDQA